MDKVVWITVLDKEKDEAAARKLHQAVSTYGLKPAGHFWQDRLEQMAWAGAREDLVKKETALWIVLGSPESLAKETIRYGLSLLALGVQSQKGHGFPIIISPTSGTITSDSLPTAFKGAEIVPAGFSGLGVKIVAKANMPVKKITTGYQLDIYGVQGLGQWFEVGPASGHVWKGVMFGVSGGEIGSHGVGPVHRLPERSVLNYPMKGLKLELGAVEYTAWAVQNELTEAEAYYVKVNNYPSAILFGPMSEGEEAEVFVINLK